MISNMQAHSRVTEPEGIPRAVGGDSHDQQRRASSTQHAQAAEDLTQKAAATTDPVEREKLLRLAFDEQLAAMDYLHGRTFQAHDLFHLPRPNSRQSSRESEDDGGSRAEALDSPMQASDDDDADDGSFEVIEPVKPRLTACTIPARQAAALPLARPASRPSRTIGTQIDDHLPSPTPLLLKTPERTRSGASSSAATATTTTTARSSQRSETPSSPTRRRPRKLEVRPKKKKPRKLEVRSSLSSAG